MLSCYLCDRVIKECCDIFYEAATEDGETVVVCGECALEHNLEFEPEDETAKTEK